MDDISEYERLRSEAQKLYHGIGPVFSPALRELMHFTAEGFNHLIYKNARSEREKPSQMLRFKILPLAAKLVALSITYQEIEDTVREFDVKQHKKRVRKSKMVRYWGIIAIIDGRKIKVIVRKIGDNGTPHFWSVVPAWMTNKYRDTRFFSTMKGHQRRIRNKNTAERRWLCSACLRLMD